MATRLSSRQLHLLGQTLDIAARPFDFVDRAQWVSQVLDQTIGLFEAKAGHFDVSDAAGPLVSSYVGYANKTTAEWVEQWRDRDDAVNASRAQRLHAYTRRWRYRLMGSEWEASYKNSAAYNEFYVPHALAVDAAGLHIDHPSGSAHLHVDCDGAWSSEADVRNLQLMGLIRPVLAASLRSIGASPAPHTDADAVFAAPEDFIAVIDGRGRWRHCGRALHEWLGTQAVSTVATWRDSVSARARTMLATSNLSQDTATSNQSTLDLGDRMASLVRHDASKTLGCEVVVLRMVRRELPDVCPASLAQYRLTARQWTVARQIACGLPTKEIASSLGVSVHTAKRHVEAVIGKLGVRSRGAVSSTVWRAAQGGW